MDDNQNNNSGNQGGAPSEPMSNMPMGGADTAPESTPTPAADPQSMPQPAPQQEQKCVTCGNAASGGTCVACGQGEISCTCQPASGGMGPGPSQGTPAA